MALPTFVLVDDVVYPVTTFSIDTTTRSSVNSDLAGVTSLVIPEGYTSVSNCSYLGNCTSVTLPESLETIGAYAFSLIPNLTSIRIPDKVYYINSSAFKASSLTSFEAKNIKGLSYGYSDWGKGDGCCFENSTSLKTVVLDGTYTQIPQKCFAGCTSLEELTIPATVSTFGYTNSATGVYSPIYNTPSLKIINYGGNMMQFKNMNFIANAIAASTSTDITVNCSDGTLHYTNGVLDE